MQLPSVVTGKGALRGARMEEMGGGNDGESWKSEPCYFSLDVHYNGGTQCTRQSCTYDHTSISRAELAKKIPPPIISARLSATEQFRHCKMEPAFIPSAPPLPEKAVFDKKME